LYFRSRFTTVTESCRCLCAFFVRRFRHVQTLLSLTPSLFVHGPCAWPPNQPHTPNSLRVPRSLLALGEMPSHSLHWQHTHDAPARASSNRLRRRVAPLGTVVCC
jgi:hypothetical protein